MATSEKEFMRASSASFLGREVPAAAANADLASRWQNVYRQGVFLHKHEKRQIRKQFRGVQNKIDKVQTEVRTLRRAEARAREERCRIDHKLDLILGMLNEPA